MLLLPQVAFRGGVDRNSIIALSRSAISASPPSRGRGSKPATMLMRGRKSCRPLRGGRGSKLGDLVEVPAVGESPPFAGGVDRNSKVYARKGEALVSPPSRGRGLKRVGDCDVPGHARRPCTGGVDRNQNNPKCVGSS